MEFSYLYTRGMNCVLCKTARPRRFCPAAQGDICSVCCGTEREVSLTCPLDCEHLRQARVRDQERMPPPAPEQYPNQDIHLTEGMFQELAPLIAFAGAAIGAAALRIPGSVDADAREAVQSLVRTYKTLQSGVYYDSAPTNPLALAMFQAGQRAVDEFQTAEKQQLGLSRTRPADVLAAFTILERMELEANNGRPRCRAFIQLISNFGSGYGPGGPGAGGGVRSWSRNLALRRCSQSSGQLRLTSRSVPQQTEQISPCAAGQKRRGRAVLHRTQFILLV